jgi:hypothetical protein
MWRHVPVKNPKPNAQEFIDILMGRTPQRRTPLVEYIVDDFVMRPIVVNLLGREWVTPRGDRESLKAYLDNFIEFWYRMGYDFVRIEIGLPFRENRLVAPDPFPTSRERGLTNIAGQSAIGRTLSATLGQGLKTLTSSRWNTSTRTCLKGWGS